MSTIPAALRAAAGRFATDAAVVDGSDTLTFGELAEQAETVAGALVRAGVEPGDRVALWAPNSLRWVVASLGVYMSGAVLVPINTRFRAQEAQHVLTTSRARLVLTVDDFPEADFVGMLRTMADLEHQTVALLSGDSDGRWPSWEAFLDLATDVDRDVARAREASLDEGSTCDIIFTSGTTGAPKGAMLAHGASVRTYEIWSELVGLQHGDRYLIVYPFFHTAGLKSGILACIIRGATIYPHAVFDVRSVMDKVASERITAFPGPPTVFQSILNHPEFSSFDLSSLRLSVTGAAVVPVQVVREMREQLAFQVVVTGYGMTETTGTISMCRHDDPPEVVAETVGKPLPGIEVRVAADDGSALPPACPGEFWVRGFNLMKGYFGDPVATAEAITPDGWLKTGDIGYVDPDGNLRITDRKKDMFIVGGFNAYPAEIEACLLAHPSLSQVAVVGAPDERLGEIGVAFVVPRAGVDVDPDEIAAWTRQRLANFKVPRRVIVCESLPLTPSGKVMKYVLKDSLR